MSHIRREFFKTLFQKRTYFGWAGLLLVPFVITIALKLSTHTPRGDGQGPGFFALIKTNGAYVPLASLMALAAFLLPLLASMSGSYTIAGEAESGTLRTVLMEPVRRGALLVAKWFVANLYVAIGLVVMGVGGLVSGWLFFGLKPMTLLSGGTIGLGQGLWLTALAFLFTFIAMAGVVSMSVFFSTLTNSSLTAVAAALVLVIIMQVLGAFSVFDFLRPYLITSHFDAWTALFKQPIDWDPIFKGLLAFGAYIAGFTGIAWWVFRRKDVLS
jgi:ABC-2 type transport system permease protein